MTLLLSGAWFILPSKSHVRHASTVLAFQWQKKKTRWQFDFYVNIMIAYSYFRPQKFGGCFEIRSQSIASSLIIYADFKKRSVIKSSNIRHKIVHFVVLV